MEASLHLDKTSHMAYSTQNKAMLIKWYPGGIAVTDTVEQNEKKFVLTFTVENFRVTGVKDKAPVEGTFKLKSNDDKRYVIFTVPGMIL